MKDQESFYGAIRREVGKGKRLAQAIYELLEKCLAPKQQEIKKRFACGAGCSACCYQLVTCTTAEAQEISLYLTSLPRKQRDKILSVARQRGQEFTAWAEATGFQGANTPEEVMGVHDHWHGKPCPFLDTASGNCTIYPVRPMDCRTYYSTVRCPDPWSAEEHKMPYPEEEWANSAMIDFQPGQQYVVPLGQWVTCFKIIKPAKR